MTNHQEHQQAPMDSLENPNLEAAPNHHHHVMLPVASQKDPNLQPTHNHHQRIMVRLDSQKNPNLETTHNHHQRSMVPLDSKKNPNLEPTHNHRVMDSQKNPNLETSRSHQHVPPSPSSSSQDFKTTHHQHMKNANYATIKKPNCSSLAAPPPQEKLTVEESGRERLKRHRGEMAGRVWIPDIWGHEDLLKDWIDCTVFDASLGNNNIMSARAALVQERRSNVRIENRC